MRQAVCSMVIGALCLGGGALSVSFLVPQQANAEATAPTDSEADTQRRTLMKAIQTSVTTIRDALITDRTGVAVRVASELSHEAKSVAKYPPTGSANFAELAMKLSEAAGALSRVQGEGVEFEDPSKKVYESWEALQKAANP